MPLKLYVWDDERECIGVLATRRQPTLQATNSSKDIKPQYLGAAQAKPCLIPQSPKKNSSSSFWNLVLCKCLNLTQAPVHKSTNPAIVDFAPKSSVAHLKISGSTAKSKGTAARTRWPIAANLKSTTNGEDKSNDKPRCLTQHCKCPQTAAAEVGPPC